MCTYQSLYGNVDIKSCFLLGFIHNIIDPRHTYIQTTLLQHNIIDHQHIHPDHKLLQQHNNMITECHRWGKVNKRAIQKSFIFSWGGKGCTQFSHSLWTLRCFANLLSQVNVLCWGGEGGGADQIFSKY